MTNLHVATQRYVINKRMLESKQGDKRAEELLQRKLEEAKQLIFEILSNNAENELLKKIK